MFKFLFGGKWSKAHPTIHIGPAHVKVYFQYSIFFNPGSKSVFVSAILRGGNSTITLWKVSLKKKSISLVYFTYSSNLSAYCNNNRLFKSDHKL